MKYDELSASKGFKENEPRLLVPDWNSLLSQADTVGSDCPYEILSRMPNGSLSLAATGLL